MYVFALYTGLLVWRNTISRSQYIQWGGQNLRGGEIKKGSNTEQYRSGGGRGRSKEISIHKKNSLTFL